MCNKSLNRDHDIKKQSTLTAIWKMNFKKKTKSLSTKDE